MEECTTYDKKSLKTVQGKTADFGELAKDCVAFANAKGGFLHIGIEDNGEIASNEEKLIYAFDEAIFAFPTTYE